MSDITPEQIIDTSENKPIEELSTELEQSTSQQTQPAQTFEIKASKVKDLTTEERLKLISDAKNGIDNPLFKVQFYKNGNSRIIKRKQPLQATSERIIKQRLPSLTTEQLLMEHVIGLETQLATLRQKQKKLKKNYKSLYQDVYVDEDEINQSSNINTIPTTKALNDIQDNIVNNNECLDNVEQQPQPQSSSELQQQNIFPRNKTNGWRARIAANMY